VINRHELCRNIVEVHSSPMMTFETTVTCESTSIRDRIKLSSPGLPLRAMSNVHETASILMDIQTVEDLAVSEHKHKSSKSPHQN
jgi:predicted butyrate kinase (DUF1464 family)